MKKELRKKYLNERDLLSKNYREDSSTKIFDLLEQLEIFRSAKKIFIYIGFGSEIQTERFIKKYINKKEFFTPKIVNSKMNLVKITSWNDLTTGHFGVLEAKSNDFYTGNIDLVITPCICFSKDGYRLGYGKGYYDKYFANNVYSTSIGLSYKKMLKDELPVESHDKKVDLLLTEEGLIITNEKYNSIN